MKYVTDEVIWRNSMRRTRKLIAAGCLCAAMTAGSAAYMFPGAAGLVMAAPSSAVTVTLNTAGTTDSVAVGAAALTAAARVGVAAAKTETAKTESAASESSSAASAETAATAQNEQTAAETSAATDGTRETAAETAETVSPYADVAVSQVGSDEDYVNIRSSATTESEIVGKIYNNCAATIEETVEAANGTWYKIHSGSVEGYIKADYFVTGDEAEALALQIGKMFGYVEEGGLRVRTEPNTESEVITKLYSGETYTVVEPAADGFVKLSLGNDENGQPVTGYVAEEYIDVYVKFDKAISLEEEQAQIEAEETRAEEASAAEESAQQAAASSTQSSTRSAVVAYAKQFVGNPYVWGGTSLTNGADCSGFTKSVMAHFGISLSRTSSAQAGNGTRVSLDSVQPGDLIFYASGGSIYHVALYIGGGQVIHAIDESRGIGISSMYCMTPYCAVDVIG